MTTKVLKIEKRINHLKQQIRIIINFILIIYSLILYNKILMS